MAPESESSLAGRYTRILGISFFHGTALQAVEIVSRGGLLVVPAAPALKDISSNPGYRESLIHADLAITDSGFMVLIWNMLHSRWITRLSGLEYQRCLLRQPHVRQPGNTLWIMANPASAKCNLAWLAEQGIDVPEEYVYLAPMYGKEIKDDTLMEQIERLRPQHIVVTLGGGTQERLGLHLKRNLSYLPAIHCTGAATAFLSGDQVHIPRWADKLYLGWLLRMISNPSFYFPRYWDARKLFGMIFRYGDRMPEPISYSGAHLQAKSRV